MHRISSVTVQYSYQTISKTRDTLLIGPVENCPISSTVQTGIYLSQTLLHLNNVSTLLCERKNFCVCDKKYTHMMHMASTPCYACLSTCEHIILTAETYT